MPAITQKLIVFCRSPVFCWSMTSLKRTMCQNLYSVELLANAIPHLSAPELWPLNSPNLNPVDHKILGIT